MNTPALTDLALKSLEDLKAQDIKTINVEKHCDFADVMIFCTGTSNRHVKSLARNLLEEAKKHSQSVLGSEGEEDGDWILVDLGDVIVHIMQAEVRDFYKVEELWEIETEQ